MKRTFWRLQVKRGKVWRTLEVFRLRQSAELRAKQLVRKGVLFRFRPLVVTY